MTSSRKAADTHEAGNAEPRRTRAPEPTQALLDVDTQPTSSDRLPGTVMAKMSAAFGVDFSAVRVHQQTRTPRAVAYTRGVDVYFRPGAYDPHSTAGLELIGHELAHVVQQFEGRVARRRLDSSPTLEREADEMGARAARGLPARSSAARLLEQLPRVSARGSTIQRRQEPEAVSGAGFQLVDALPVAPRLAEFKGSIKLPTELSELLDEASESDSLHELTIGLYKVTGDDAKTRFELALSWQGPEGQAHATLAVDLDALGRSFMQRFEQPLQQLGTAAPQLRIDEADSAKRNAVVIKAGPSPAWLEAEWKLDNLVKAASGRRFQLAPDRFKLEHKRFGLLAKGDYERPIGTQVGEAFQIPELEDLSALRSLAGVGEDTKLCCAVYWDAGSRTAGLALDPTKATLDSDERLPVAFGVAVNVQTLLDGVARVASSIARLLPREDGGDESNDLLARLANAARSFVDGLLSIRVDALGSFDFDLGRLLPRISTGGGFDWSRFVPGRFSLELLSLKVFRLSAPELPAFESISKLTLPKAMVPRIEGWLAKLVPELSGDEGLRRALQGLPLELLQFGGLDLGLRFELGSLFDKLGLDGVGLDQLGLRIDLGALLDRAGVIGQRLRAWFEGEGTSPGQSLAKLFHLGNDLVLRIYDDPQGNRIGFDLAPLLDGDLEAVTRPVELQLAAAGLARLAFGRRSNGVVVLGEHGSESELRVRTPREWLLADVPVDGEAKAPLDVLFGLPKDAVVHMSLALDRRSLHVLVSVEQPAVAMIVTIEHEALTKQLRGLLPPAQLGSAGSMLDMLRVEAPRSQTEHALVVEFGPPEHSFGFAQWSLARLMRLGIDASALLPDRFELRHETLGSVSKGPFVRPSMNLVGDVFSLDFAGKSAVLDGARELAGAPADATLYCAVYEELPRIGVGLSADAAVLASTGERAQDEAESPSSGFLAQIDLQVLLGMIEKLYDSIQRLLPQRDGAGASERAGLLDGLNHKALGLLDGVMSIELPRIGKLDFDLRRLIPQLSGGGGFDWSKFMPDGFSLNFGPVAAFRLPQGKLPSFTAVGASLKLSANAFGQVHGYLSRLIPELPELEANGESLPDLQLLHFNGLQIGLALDVGALLSGLGLDGVGDQMFALRFDLGVIPDMLGGLGDRLLALLSKATDSVSSLAEWFDLDDEAILRVHEPGKPSGSRIAFDLKRLLSDEPATALRPVELHLVDELGTLSYGALEDGAIVQGVPGQDAARYEPAGERLIANMAVTDAARTTLVQVLDGAPKSAVRLSLYVEGFERAQLLVDVEQPPLGLLISLEFAPLLDAVAKFMPPSSNSSAAFDKARIDRSESKQAHALVLEFGPAGAPYGSATWRLERFLQLDSFEPSALIPDSFSLGHDDIGHISKGPFTTPKGWKRVGQSFEIGRNAALQQLADAGADADMYVAVYDARPTLGLVLGPSAASVEGRDRETVAFAGSVNLQTLLETVEKLGAAAAGLVKRLRDGQGSDLSARIKAAILRVVDGLLDLRIEGLGSIGFDLGALLPRVGTREGFDWSQLVPSRFDLEFAGLRLFRQTEFEQFTGEPSSTLELTKDQIGSVAAFLTELAPDLSAVLSGVGIRLELYALGELRLGLGLRLIVDSQGLGQLPDCFGLIVDLQPLLEQAGKAGEYLLTKLGGRGLERLGSLFHLGPGPTLLIYENYEDARVGFDLSPLLRGDFAATLIPTQLHFAGELGSISYGALDVDGGLGISRPTGEPLVAESQIAAGYEWLAERLGLEGTPPVLVSLYRGGGQLQLFGRIEQPARAVLITINEDELTTRMRALMPKPSGQAGSEQPVLAIDAQASVSQAALRVRFGSADEPLASATWKLERFVQPDFDWATLMPDEFSLGLGRFGHVGRGPFTPDESWRLVGGQGVSLGAVPQLGALYDATDEQTDVYCAAYDGRPTIALVLGPTAEVVEGKEPALSAFVVELDIEQILAGMRKLGAAAARLMPSRSGGGGGGDWVSKLRSSSLRDGGLFQLDFEFGGGSGLFDFELASLLPRVIAGDGLDLSQLVPSSFEFELGPVGVFRLPKLDFDIARPFATMKLSEDLAAQAGEFLSGLLPDLGDLSLPDLLTSLDIKLVSAGDLKLGLVFDLGGLVDQLGELGSGLGRYVGLNFNLQFLLDKAGKAGEWLLTKLGKGGDGLRRYVHLDSDLILRIYANPNGNRVGFDLERLLGGASIETLMPVELHLEAENFGQLNLGESDGTGVTVGERELVPPGDPVGLAFALTGEAAELARMLLGAAPGAQVELSFYRDSKQAHLFVRSIDPARALAITLEYAAIKAYLSKLMPKLPGGGRKPKLPEVRLELHHSQSEPELRVAIGSGDPAPLSASWKIARFLRPDVDWDDLVPDTYSFGNDKLGRIGKAPITLGAGWVRRAFLPVGNNEVLRTLVGSDGDQELHCAIYQSDSQLMVALGPEQVVLGDDPNQSGFLAVVELEVLLASAKRLGDKLAKLLPKSRGALSHETLAVAQVDNMLQLSAELGGMKLELGFDPHNLSRIAKSGQLDWSQLVPDRFAIGMLALQRGRADWQPSGEKIDIAALADVTARLYKMASLAIPELPEMPELPDLSGGEPPAAVYLDDEGEKLELSLVIDLDKIHKSGKYGKYGVTLDLNGLLDKIGAIGKSLLEKFSGGASAPSIGKFVHVGKDLVLRVIYPNEGKPEYQIGFDLTPLLNGDVSAALTPVELLASIGTSKHGEQPLLQLTMGRLDSEGRLRLGDAQGDPANSNAPQVDTSKPTFEFAASTYICDLLGLPPHAKIGISLSREAGNVRMVAYVVGSDRVILLTLNDEAILDALGKLAGQSPEDGNNLEVTWDDDGYLSVGITIKALKVKATWRIARFFDGTQDALVLAIPDRLSIDKGGLGVMMGSDFDIGPAGPPVVRDLEVPAALRDKLQLGSEGAAFADLYATLGATSKSDAGLVMAIAIKERKGAPVDPAHAMGLMLTLSGELLDELKQKALDRIAKAGNKSFSNAKKKSKKAFADIEYWIDPEAGGLALGRQEAGTYVMFSISGIADAMTNENLAGLMPIGFKVATETFNLQMIKLPDGTSSEELPGADYTSQVDSLPELIRNPLTAIGLDGDVYIGFDPTQSHVLDVGEDQVLYLRGHIYRKSTKGEITDHTLINLDVSIWDLLDSVVPGMSSEKVKKPTDKDKKKDRKRKNKNLTFNAGVDDGRVRLEGNYKKDKAGDKRDKKLTLTAYWSVSQLISILLKLSTEPAAMDPALLVPEELGGIFEAEKFALRFDLDMAASEASTASGQGQESQISGRYAMYIYVRMIPGLGSVLEEFMGEEAVRQTQIELCYPEAEDLIGIVQNLDQITSYVYFVGARLWIGSSTKIDLDFGVSPKILLNLLAMIPGLQAGKLALLLLEAVQDPEAAIEAAIHTPELIYYAVTAEHREVDWDDLDAKNMVMAFAMNDKSVKQLAKMAYVHKRMTDAGREPGLVNNATLELFMNTPGGQYEEMAKLFEDLSDADIKTLMDIEAAAKEHVSDDGGGIGIDPAQARAAIDNANELISVLEAGYVTGKAVVEAGDVSSEERDALRARAVADMATYANAGARPLSDRIGGMPAPDGAQQLPAAEGEIESIADLPEPSEEALAEAQRVLNNEEKAGDESEMASASQAYYDYLVLKYAWMSIDQLIQIYAQGRISLPAGANGQARTMTLTSQSEKGFVKLLIEEREPGFAKQAFANGEAVEKAGDLVKAWERYKNVQQPKIDGSKQQVDESGAGGEPGMSGGESDIEAGEPGADGGLGEDQGVEPGADAEAEAQDIWADIEQEQAEAEWDAAEAEWDAAEGESDAAEAEADTAEGEGTDGVDVRAYFAPSADDFNMFKMLEWRSAEAGQDTLPSLVVNQDEISRFKTAVEAADLRHPESKAKALLANVEIAIEPGLHYVTVAYEFTFQGSDGVQGEQITTHSVRIGVSSKPGEENLVFDTLEEVDYLALFGIDFDRQRPEGSRVMANAEEVAFGGVVGDLIACKDEQKRVYPEGVLYAVRVVLKIKWVASENLIWYVFTDAEVADGNQRPTANAQREAVWMNDWKQKDQPFAMWIMCLDRGEGMLELLVG